MGILEENLNKREENGCLRNMRERAGVLKLRKVSSRKPIQMAAAEWPQ